MTNKIIINKLSQVAQIVLYLFNIRVNFNDKQGIVGINDSLTHLPATKSVREDLKKVYELIKLEVTSDLKYYIPSDLWNYTYLMYVTFNDTCTMFTVADPIREECGTEAEYQDKCKAYLEYKEKYYPLSDEYKELVAKKAEKERKEKERFEKSHKDTIVYQPQFLCDIANKLHFYAYDDINCSLGQKEGSIDITFHTFKAFSSNFKGLYLENKFKSGSHYADEFVSINLKHPWLDKCHKIVGPMQKVELEKSIFSVCDNIDDKDDLTFYRTLISHRSEDNLYSLLHEYFKERGIPKEDYSNERYQNYIALKNKFLSTEQEREKWRLREEALALDFD